MTMNQHSHLARRLCRASGIATLNPNPQSISRNGVFVMSAFLLAACAPPDRGANTPLPPPSAAFDWADADADGDVEAHEWNDASNKLFTSIDIDNDGAISPVETHEGFDSLDINRDGVIDKGEADIANLDTDGDGVISRAEWQGDILHQNLDADGDGKVSRAEYDAHHTRIFTTHDVDANSRVERIELAPDAAKLTLFRF